MLTLSSDFLLVHLRMSGDIRVEPSEAVSAPHDRVHLYFIDGVRLAFNDTRKFGRMWLVRDVDSVIPAAWVLNPSTRRLTAAVFHQMMQRTQQTDQTAAA